MPRDSATRHDSTERRHFLKQGDLTMSDIANREHTREQGTGIVKPDDSNPYIAYGQAAARTRIIGKLLKFNKFGVWTCGEANDEMPEGTELVVHMGEFYV